MYSTYLNIDMLTSNHRKKIKAERSRLIPRKLAGILEFLTVNDSNSQRTIRRSLAPRTHYAQMTGNNLFYAVEVLQVSRVSGLCGIDDFH